ncbi:MAG: hypothetical protein ACJ76Z_12460 [Thermoleophilaceae bacterium]
MLPAGARAEMGWSPVERVVSDSQVRSVAVGMDRAGVATFVWSTQGSVWTATRPPQGTLAKPELIAKSTGTMHLAVSEAGDAALAWTDPQGNTFATARSPGGRFAAPRLIEPRPAFEGGVEPSVAIADGGWAVVAVVPVSTGGTFVSSIRAPAEGFAEPQTFNDGQPTAKAANGLNVGIDSRGYALVAYRIDECPLVQTEPSCSYPVKVTVSEQGGAFAAPFVIGQGAASYESVPNVAVSPTGHVTLGFLACYDHRYCKNESQVVDGQLPGRFDKAVTLTRQGGKDEAGNHRPEVASLRDGASLAYFWWDQDPVVLRALRTGDGWAPPEPVAGKAKFRATRSDSDGDVVFFQAYESCPGDGCQGIKLQRWNARSGGLSDPVVISPNPTGIFDLAPAPGAPMAAFWRADYPNYNAVEVRVWEDLPATAQAKDASPPLVAVSAPPRTAAPVMRLRATCDEICTLAASGRLRIGTRTFPVRGGSKKLRAGRGTTLVVSVRKRSRAEVRRARGRKTLALRITARDDAGNRRVVRRTFRLR